MRSLVCCVMVDWVWRKVGGGFVIWLRFDEDSFVDASTVVTDNLVLVERGCCDGLDDVVVGFDGLCLCRIGEDLDFRVLIAMGRCCFCWSELLFGLHCINDFFGLVLIPEAHRAVCGNELNCGFAIALGIAPVVVFVTFRTCAYSVSIVDFFTNGKLLVFVSAFASSSLRFANSFSNLFVVSVVGFWNVPFMVVTVA